jgi:dTMP kinase
LRGLFISLEGPDGSGKSTQARLLCECLRNLRVPVLVTREPGGSKAADAIRGVLLDPSLGGLSDRAELLLFAASRHQHLQDTILPALRKGKVVICDRYVDSTTAYQAHGRRFASAQVAWINRFSSQNLLPDITLLFDLPEAEGLKRAARAKHGSDRMEAQGPAFHRRVRQGYLQLARRQPRRIKLIKVAGLTPDEVLTQSLAALGPFLQGHGHVI